MSPEHFKTCPCCDTSWHTREAFLSDPRLRLDGYTPDFEHLDLGLFYFTHSAPGCGSTLTMHVSAFADLYTGRRHPERKTLGPECPRLCTQKDNLDRCEAMCECAFVREILQIVKNRGAEQSAA